MMPILVNVMTSEVEQSLSYSSDIITLANNCHGWLQVSSKAEGIYVHKNYGKSLILIN